MENEFMGMMAAGMDAVGFANFIRSSAATGLGRMQEIQVLAVIGP